MLYNSKVYVINVYKLTIIFNILKKDITQTKLIWTETRTILFTQNGFGYSVVAVINHTNYIRPSPQRCVVLALIKL